MSPRLLRPLATGFNPRSISGLALWIDFADTASVTLDVNSKISDVLDKSGNGLHGTQGTSGNRLGVSTLNGRQCADNGTSSNTFRITYARGANTDNWRDGFVAAVWDGGGSTFPSFNSFFSAAAATGTAGGAMLNGNSGSADLLGGTNWHGSAASTRLNNTFVSGGGITAFPDITSTFVFQGTSNASMGVDGWQIGTDRSGAGRGWRGRTGEVIIFNRVLSASEGLKVRRYLAAKWGAPAQT
jgi:hypothetical protein